MLPIISWRRIEHGAVLCVLVSFIALCGQAEKQPIEAAGEVSSDGREPAALRLWGFHHRPGGDGGGVDSTTVRGPETAVAVGTTGDGRGPSLATDC